MSEPIEVTDDSLDDVIHSHSLVVVDCWAPWCGPCRKIGPVIDELADDYEGKIVFGKLNVDENPGTSMKYKIMSIPTILIFKEGRLVDSPKGAMPKRLLEPKITKYL